MDIRRNQCFFIMPFREELHFWFLYLKNYLEQTYGLHVERADHDVLTSALIEKIKWRISRSDVIVADITGGNPNVFYEIGYAHAMSKPSILLTRDSPKDAPVDVRGLEVIHYSLSDEQNLLAKLDNAIYNVFKPEYREVYEDALQCLDSFNEFAGVHYLGLKRENFQVAVMNDKHNLPSKKEKVKYSGYLLSKILSNANDIELMRIVLDWVEKRENE